MAGVRLECHGPRWLAGGVAKARVPWSCAVRKTMLSTCSNRVGTSFMACPFPRFDLLPLSTLIRAGGRDEC